MINDKIIPVRIEHDDLERLAGEFTRSPDSGSISSRTAYRRMLAEFLKYVSARTDFDFTAEDADKYKKHLAINKNLSPNSVKSYFSAFRKFCAFLKSRGYIDRNPARLISVKSAEPADNELSYLSRNELQTLIDSCGDDFAGLRDSVIILLIIYYEMNYSDLINLSFSDVHIDRNFAEIFGRNISVRHSRRLIAYMEQFADAEPESPLIISLSKSTHGERITRRGLTAALSSRLANAGIPKTPRALFATGIILYAKKVRSRKKIMEKYGIKMAETAGRYLEAARNY